MSGLAEYPIVDGDGHVMEPDDLWLERMDKKRWGDWIPYRTMGAVPLQDIDRAVEEVERCINGLGHKGVFIRPSAYIDELPLNHPVYDRFWAACQDLDAAVAFHPGSYADTPGACKFFRLVSDSPNIMASSMAMDEIHGGAALGQAVG